jgi:hypothetical protein
MPHRKSSRPHKKTAVLRKASRPAKRTKVSAVQAKRVATKKTFTIRSLHIGTHLAIAGSAIAVLLLLGYVDRNTFATLASHATGQSNTATIGLEHDQPLKLSVIIARKDGAGYASITNNTPNTVHISTPSAWNRVEVTGAPITSVVQEIPVFGFTRWTLPPNAGIRLFMPSVPDAVFFDSPSPVTAAVELQAVDLNTSLVNNRVVLVQKQALANLWTTEE